MKDNTFEENDAKYYGPHIGCFAQRIVLITEEEYYEQIEIANQDKLRLLEEEETNSTKQVSDIEIDSARSGAQIPEMFVALVDKYGQIVGSDSSTKLTVLIDSTYHEDNARANDFLPVIEGASQFYSQGGVFDVKDIYFTATPGESYLVTLATDGIDGTKPSNKEYLISINETYSQFEVQIDLR